MCGALAPVSWKFADDMIVGLGFVARVLYFGICVRMWWVGKRGEKICHWWRLREDGVWGDGINGLRGWAYGWVYLSLG